MLKLYNSLTRKKQVFKPLIKNIVTVYSCGPTVYDYAHIGNFRSYIAWDVLHRFLEYSGYKTNVVKNITDVGHFTEDVTDEGEDKLEKAARREKKGPLEIAKFYIKQFLEHEKKLNILTPSKRPRATLEIKAMQKIIQGLIKKGYAYNTRDGVYFNVAKFPAYGKLSGNTPKKILAGARVKINPTKIHPADFALWKKRVGGNRRHWLHWNSPWGDGFPGWHIECSAMALKYLGETIDIHTGGQDNKFPHHESEIAQSESFTGKPFARFWLHTGLIDVLGKKMSKSLGNFYTLQDIIKKGFDPLAYRFWVLTAHYRSPMNFSWKGLKEASGNWEKVVDFYFTNKSIVGTGLRPVRTGQSPVPTSKIYISQKSRQFTAALNDDLNTSKAIALLLEVIKDANKDQKKIPAVVELIKIWDRVLGILPAKPPVKKKIAIPPEIQKLLDDRQKARANKDFNGADEIRKMIEKLGFKLTDTANGKTSINSIPETRLLPKK